MANITQYLPRLFEGSKYLKEIHDLQVHAQIKTGKENNIIQRQNDEQQIIDEEIIKIDRKNVELKKFLEDVPRDEKKQRIEKGKYEELADDVNA